MFLGRPKPWKGVLQNGMKSLAPLECFMAVLVQLMDGSVVSANQRMLTTQRTTSVVITRDVE